MKPKANCKTCFGRGVMRLVQGTERKLVVCSCVQAQVTRQIIKDREARNAIANERVMRRRSEAAERAE